MHHFRLPFGVLVGAVAAGLWLNGPLPARAQELPEGLRHVPRDAMGFAHVRVSELLQTKLGKQLAQAGQVPLRELEEITGIRASDVETVTAMLLAPAPADPGARERLLHHMHDEFDRFPDGLGMIGAAAVVTTREPYDRKKLLRLLEEGRGYLSLVCLSERSFLLGPPDGLAQYADHVAHPSDKNDRLQGALELAAKKHLIVAGGHLPKHLRTYWMATRYTHRPSPFGRGMDETRLLGMLAPLANVRVAVLTFDVENSAMKTSVQLHGTNEQSTDLALETVKTGMALLENIPSEDFPLAESMGKIFANAKTKRQGNLAQIELEGNAEAINNALTMLSQGSARTRSANNLKQIGIALHSYNDVYKRLPPQTINDPNGKPLLSWRVAILPFIEQQSLYQQFDLNQPWDHPTNKKLIEKMPDIYAPVMGNAAPGMTHYQVFAGTGLPMDAQGMARNAGQPPMAKMHMAQLPDGSSNTIAVTEAADPVIWTKPDDLPYNRKQPLPRIGMFKDGFHVLMYDGAVFFKRKITEETLHRAIDPADGQPLGQDWFGDARPFLGGSAPAKTSVPVFKERFEEKKIEERKLEVPARIIFRKDAQLAANDMVDPVRQAACKTYDVALKAGRRYVIDMRSPDFDTYLRLESGGQQLASDDDGGDGLNSRIEFTPERDGDYRIIATSFGGNRTGGFALTVGER